MKRISILIAVTAVLMAGALSIPQMVSATLPSVTVIKLENNAYTDEMTATGKLEELSKSEIKADLPVVASNVYVDLGDTVEVGDVIADIDIDKSKQAVLSMVNMYDLLPDSLTSLIASIDLGEISEDQLTALIPTQIVADYSGVISSLNLTPGAIASPTDTVATISDLSDLRAVISVPEEYASQVKLGQEVSMKISALDNRAVSGSISMISPVAHETLVGTSKQTVMNVYVALDEQDTELKSGYSVTGTIKLEEDEDILTVPYSAVNQYEDGTEYVYVYENGRAKERAVVTGRELSGSVEISAGLHSDEWVIEDNAMISRNGQYVSVKEA